MSTRATNTTNVAIQESIESLWRISEKKLFAASIGSFQKSIAVGVTLILMVPAHLIEHGL